MLALAAAGGEGGGGTKRNFVFKSFSLELTGNESRPSFRTVGTLVIRTFEESLFEEAEYPYLYNMLYIKQDAMITIR